MFTDLPPPSAPPALISEQWAAPATPVPVSDPRIKVVVAAMLKEAPPHADAANHQGELQKVVFGSAASEKFASDFTSARVPSCGGNDALKFQPARIGPVGFGGIFAIPFAALAAVRGKCLAR